MKIFEKNYNKCFIRFTINKWLDTSTNIFYIETDKISKENECKY